MLKFARLAALTFALGSAHAAGPKAEVIHWWTSGGESAAVKTLADAYIGAGGVWVDTAIALGEQARAVAVNRILGGNPPTAAPPMAQPSFCANEAAENTRPVARRPPFHSP